MIKKNILITGNSSRFCRFIKKELKNHKIFFTRKNKNLIILI